MNVICPESFYTLNHVKLFVHICYTPNQLKIENHTVFTHSFDDTNILMMTFPFSPSSHTHIIYVTCKYTLPGQTAEIRTEPNMRKNDENEEGKKLGK
jgi:hypothetical protein